MPDVKTMTTLIENYRTAQSALSWFKNYDWEDKTRQVDVSITLVSSNTDGAADARAMLKQVYGDIATQLRDAAIAEAEAIVAGFHSAMTAELDQP